MIMLAATGGGQDLASRLAARLRVPHASDCISFQVTAGGALAAVRPAYGGQAHQVVGLRGRQPWVITLRPGAAGVGRATAGRRADVERVVPEIAPERLSVRVIGLVEADPATIDLAEAELVVAGGRGAGGPDGWKQIQGLAEALGASLGATRPAVDQGWAPFDRQIGQTGKTVKARLYVACGISGASQHTLGMQQSEVIVAINTDKSAPIMKMAHLALVGDLRAVIPALVRRIRTLRRAEQVVP